MALEGRGYTGEKAHKWQWLVGQHCGNIYTCSMISLITLIVCLSLIPEGSNNAQTMDASQSCREKKNMIQNPPRSRGMESARKYRQIVQAVVLTA